MGVIFQDGVNFRDGQMVVEKDGRVTETITTTDTKSFFTTAVNAFFMQDQPYDDTQWLELFTVINSRSHGELFPFRPPTITDTVTGVGTPAAGSHGIVFEQVGEAGEIKFSKVVSGEKYVKNVKYATAIGYSNEWFSDGSMGLVEMVTQDFRDSAADKMAAIHYGAIVAAVSTGVSVSAAATTDGASDGASSIGLMNALNAATTIMRRNRRMPRFLLTPPENEFVVNSAAAAAPAQRPDLATPNKLVRGLTTIVTEYLAANTVYVVEPKRRLVSTNRLPLTLGNFSDLLTDSEVLVGKFRRGVLVGEGQVIRAISNVGTLHIPGTFGPTG